MMAWPFGKRPVAVAVPWLAPLPANHAPLNGCGVCACAPPACSSMAMASASGFKRTWRPLRLSAMAEEDACFVTDLLRCMATFPFHVPLLTDIASRRMASQGGRQTLFRGFQQH